MITTIIITATICTSVVAISLGGIYQDYRLKKENIRADAMVRAEEIKAKNQLEIEKMYISSNQQPAVRASDYFDDDYRTSRVNKEKL